MTSRFAHPGAQANGPVVENRTNSFGLIDSKWKLIYRDNAKETGINRVELYDRTSDRTEKTNVAAQHPREVERMMGGDREVDRCAEADSRDARARRQIYTGSADNGTVAQSRISGRISPMTSVCRPCLTSARARRRATVLAAASILVDVLRARRLFYPKRMIVARCRWHGPRFCRAALGGPAEPAPFDGIGGSFMRLRTSTPPQSPVAWSTFITGTAPSAHGIFDFVHRDPATLAPILFHEQDGRCAFSRSR